MWESIVWLIDDLIYWRVYMVLGLEEVIISLFTIVDITLKATKQLMTGDSQRNHSRKHVVKFFITTLFWNTWAKVILDNTMKTRHADMWLPNQNICMIYH